MCPHCTHSQINSVQQKSFLGNQHFLSHLKIPQIYGNESFIYCVQLQPAFVPVMRQTQLINKTLSSLFIIHYNVSLLSIIWSSKWSPSLRYPHQNPVCTSPLSPINVTCPTQLITILASAQILLGGECESCSTSLRSFLQSPATSSLPSAHIFLNTLFVHQHHSSLNVRNKVSHA